MHKGYKVFSSHWATHQAIREQAGKYALESGLGGNKQLFNGRKIQLARDDTPSRDRGAEASSDPRARLLAQRADRSGLNVPATQLAFVAAPPLEQTHTSASPLSSDPPSPRPCPRNLGPDSTRVQDPRNAFRYSSRRHIRRTDHSSRDTRLALSERYLQRG